MHLEISGDFFGPVGALELPGLLPPWTWGGFRFTRASNYLLLSLGFFQPAAHGGGLAKFRSEQLLCFSGISLMAAWINEAIFSIDPTQEANELPAWQNFAPFFSCVFPESRWWPRGREKRCWMRQWLWESRVDVTKPVKSPSIWP